MLNKDISTEQTTTTVRKARLIEIFNSVQGEGKYAGVRQVFVRFFGCNIHCVWCDTPHSIGDTVRKFKEMDLEAMLRSIDIIKDGCHSISLTGGEPLLQKDFIKQLLPELRRRQLPVYLDTNGTLPEELSDVIDGIDIVAMDIKLPSSAKCASFWDEHAEFLRIARSKEVFVKAVISLETEIEEVKRAVEMVAAVDANILLILQPNSFEIGGGVVQKCMSLQDLCARRLKDVRVVPQMHRYLKVR